MIIQKYPETHSFLKFFLHSGPLHIGKVSIHRKLPTESSPITNNVPDSIEELMRRLSERRISGYNAIRTVQTFINKHQEHCELLVSILEKDLRIGIAGKLLEKALKADQLIDANSIDAQHITTTTSSSKKGKVYPKTSKALPVALGVPLQHPSLKISASEGTNWLISRKLDGIRCLTHCNARGASLLTRAGNKLDNLPEIQIEVQHVAQSIREKYPEMVDFYLDGELVAFALDNNTADIDKLSDDFRSTLSIVASSRTNEEKGNIRPENRQRLVYFLFDLIDRHNLCETTLSERLAQLQSAIKGLLLAKVYLLKQHMTKDPFEFRNHLVACKSNKWEGLILRRDAPHIPRRSKDIIKIKDFYEAEFDIVDYKLEKMQVSQNGRMHEEILLSAVKVMFGKKGVWVGSGFSLEERRKYAQDPKVLSASQATVRYFQESSNRHDSLKSLRFPTIKAIYSGQREL